MNKKTRKVEISLFDLAEVDKKAKRMYKSNQIVSFKVENKEIPKLKIEIKPPQEKFKKSVP